MPGRLSVEHMDQLEEWISAGPKQFHLLYSITRDGLGQFHRICDNRGPTVTVVYNTQGSVYGGYTSLAWLSSDGQFKRDDHAFLFQLVFSYERRFRKFHNNKTVNSVHHNRNTGPIFGSGPDLCLFTKNGDPVNGVYVLNNAGGCMKPSDSFVYDGVEAADINNGTMNAVEIEVYSVSGTSTLLVYK